MTATEAPRREFDPDLALSNMTDFLTIGARSAEGYGRFADEVRGLVNHLNAGGRLPARWRHRDAERGLVARWRNSAREHDVARSHSQGREAALWAGTSLVYERCADALEAVLGD